MRGQGGAAKLALRRRTLEEQQKTESAESQRLAEIRTSVELKVARLAWLDARRWTEKLVGC